MNFIRRNRIFALFAFLFLYLTGWHLVLSAISSWSLFSEIRLPLLVKVVEYALISGALTAGISGASFLLKTKSAWIRRTVFGAVLFLFAFDGAVRVLDFGTIYFSGQHVDNEFWYHAFYTDGTSFILTVPAAVLLICYAVALFLFVKSYLGAALFMAE